MKVNFNADFKDFNGEPLLVDGNPQVIGHIVAQCLFNGRVFVQVAICRQTTVRRCVRITFVCG